MKIVEPTIKSVSFSRFKVAVYDGYYISNESNIQKSENVICYDENNDVMWKIHDAKESGYWLERDYFVGVALHKNGDLGATTRSGHAFRVDKQTGKATYSEFMK